MAFHALADYQNHVIGWLQWEQSSLGDGAVVRFPRIWMSSGECRLKRPRDLNRWAKRTIDVATGEVEDMLPDKEAVAVALDTRAEQRGSQANKYAQNHSGDCSRINSFDSLWPHS